ncbi:TonB-dependent receptor plug domain-containing protein [Sphingorhabdus lacus]|uniref:TonB-dependent receptor n=1 Tax=Sphingorhabdus lacus TaxID=392610 RepID=A0A6I6LAG9_9SPHN|nr:TonB-dependent receptor [Sphingorhabdus lacus]QGY81076.1 TonB-dependent receptor [Sphingorhabdus lacus]
MKTTRTYKLRYAAAPLAIGLALLSTPSFAQEAADEEDSAGEIVVTGSLIRNPNLVQSTPVNATTAYEIDLLQSNVAEEVLRELPGVVPSIGSAVNNGNAGASYVDLRGLGSERNIVLLDGQRIVPADLQGRVDLNNVPLALVERVDALTGAAVTTYGADAITGVVNFITRKDFAGAEISGGSQLTEKSDGHTFRIDATVGGNFDDGRGNAVLSIGYQQADPVFQGDRDFSFEQISSFTGGAGGSGTAVPSRFSGTRPLDPATGLPSVDPTVQNGGVRQVNAAGAAVAPFASFNFNPFNVFQTPFKRFNIFAQANYEISDAVEVYTRGMFSKNTVDTIIAPSGAFGGSVNINLNNPFLPATLRNQFCAFDVNPREDIYTPRFTPAQCAAAATATGRSDPNYREIGLGGFVAFDVNNDGILAAKEGFDPNPAITLNRRTPEVGPRISNYVTTVFDYRLGLRGAISDSIDWDISGAYGESENAQAIKNFTLQSRFRQAALADSATSCQNSSNGCVPVNLFGPEGSITPEMAAFLTADSTTIVRTTLAQVRGTISGDAGFASPWASEAVGFAVGGEFREYGATQSSDLLAQTPGELGGAGGAAPNIDGNYSVYEAFGEIIAPIVEDKPMFHSLTLDAGLRYSSYTVKGATSQNQTTTWKAGGSWEPVESLKFRGNYSRAVRAPNIGELFTPQTVGLTNLSIDPCAGAAPTSNANLRAICIAQGAPVGSIGSITNPTAGQANLTVGGNLDLKPEKADTLTLGFVYQPDFVPGFNVSLDYYNIKIDSVIGTALPGDIIAACFGAISASSATSAACTNIRRNPLTGGLDGDPATTGGLFGPTNNLGKLATDGFDLLANWKGNIGAADLTLSFVGNWTRSSKFNANPSDPGSLNRECVGFYSVNCSFTGSIQPEFQTSTRVTFGYKDVDLSFLWRWMDAVQYEPAQLEAERAAADAANRNDAGVLLPINLAQIGKPGFQGCPNFETTDEGGCLVEEGFRRIGAEHYFDLTARWNASDNFSFTFTIQNLLDNKPKLVGNTIGSTAFNSGNVFPSTYDALGRRFGVAAKLTF